MTPFPSLCPMSTSIVEASVDIYTYITQNMLPTPSKSHYTFNLRDLSKVIQGVLQIHKDFLPDSDTLLRLWLHESSRVFRDRLIDDKDRSEFNHLCETMLQKYFQVQWDESLLRDLLFGDYTTTGEGRPYKECPDKQLVETMMNSHLAVRALSVECIDPIIVVLISRRVVDGVCC